MPTTRVQRARTRTGAVVLALILTACTPGVVPEPTGADSTGPKVNTTFTFGTAADPVGLDPALVNDNESYRVTRQVLETLVGVNDNTGAPAALLARSWTKSPDGKSYTFTLRKDVDFQDGTAFNAAAVCTNFKRWFHLPKSLQDIDAGSTFKSVFHAFADTPELSTFKKCTALDPLTVRIDLTEDFTGFLAALSAPGLALSSPTALRKGSADKLNKTRAGQRLSSYGQHPVGTGPFVFKSWHGDEVTLAANHQYWGQKSQIQKLVFRTLTHPEARFNALARGSIDGYDMVTVDNFQPLAQAGLKVMLRDPFSVAYLGINQQYGALKDRKVREALAYAVDKKSLISKYFINGTTTADQFIPPKLGITDENIPKYSYDPDKAKALLKASSYDGGPITFYYPRHVTRAYLPSPEKAYAELSKQLTAVGFNIEPVPIEWSDDYLKKVQSPGNHGLHLLGWSGSYQDPDNFVGALFGTKSGEFGFSDPALFRKIDEARTLPAGDSRRAAYQSIDLEIATLIPAVPLAFPISAVALSDRVQSYPVSPVMNEVFNKIVLSR